MAKKISRPKAANPNSLPTLIETFLRTERESKEIFAAQQKLLAVIAKRAKPGGTYHTPLGTVQLIDKFADKTMVFKNTAFNRFELRVVAD